MEPSFQKLAEDAKMEDVVQQEVEYEVQNEFRVHAKDEARNEDEIPAIGLQKEFQWVAESNPPLAPSTLYTKPPLKRKLDQLISVNESSSCSVNFWYTCVTLRIVSMYNYIDSTSCNCKKSVVFEG